ncbi:phenylacetaldoxime dehydratase family protein [Cumulibacter soli]|uniref:phenylacetaldoxime dehydratase family protein n=1 Tax=Cumulibacter soli TaxID=2546344 RepID=UPI001068B3A3|nr:phenylacetaldoxime dehydratase family protein [Cumulibacter soli]
MESAVPAHLRVKRTEPARMRDDWNPPSPAFSPRLSPEVTGTVMGYYGLQYRGERPTAADLAHATLTERIESADGPVYRDTAVVRDPAGYTNEVSVLYWLDQEQFRRWELNHPSWTAADRPADGLGYFQEIALPGANDFEMITGGRRQEGVATQSESISEPIAEHAYWGSMRDRLPSSQTSALEAHGELTFDDDGDLVVVKPHDGMALIRSGQDWVDTEDEARAWWLERIQPVLREGMDFLTTQGRPIGCYSNRLMQLSADGQPIEKTYGHSWWHSLSELEDWSRSHQTHLKIFGSFGQFIKHFKGAAGLRLYHEVAVLDADQLRFEYLHCHPETGLLGARPNAHL